MLETGDPAVTDFDQNGPLGPRLSWVSALKVARIDDVRVLAEHGMSMDVAQCPIVITMIGELLGRAGRIASVMTFAARTGRVENANIEHCLGCCWIFARQIFRDVRAGEAPPVDCDPDIFETMCGGLCLRKDMNVARKGQLVSKTIGGVMVSKDHEHRDAGFVQPAHSFHEVKARLEVTQIAIENVTGQQHEPAALIDRKGNQVIEGFTRRCLYARGVVR